MRRQAAKKEAKTEGCTPGAWILRKGCTESREGAPCQFACVITPNRAVCAFSIPKTQGLNSFRNGVLSRARALVVGHLSVGIA